MATTANPTVNGQLRYELARHVQDVASEMSKDEIERAKTYAAMDFVLKGAVDLGKMTVTSGLKVYHIDPMSGCPCEDAQYRSRYCKHTVALDMARTVSERMGDDYMAATKNAQEEWEAKTQNAGPQGTDELPNMFTPPAEAEALEPEPNDIPDPEVPEELKLTPGVVYTPSGIPGGPVQHSGHQYTDYPSTLCIKRQIGHTELMWTFRDTNDTVAWQRAAKMIKVLDDAAARYAPPVQMQTPPAQAPPSQAPPSQAPPQQGGERAVNHGVQQDSPWCATHSVYYELWSKAGRKWFSHKGPEGFCNQGR